MLGWSATPAHCTLCFFSWIHSNTLTCLSKRVYLPFQRDSAKTRAVGNPYTLHIVLFSTIITMNSLPPATLPPATLPPATLLPATFPPRGLSRPLRVRV